MSCYREYITDVGGKLDLEDIFRELEGGSVELLSVLSKEEIGYFLEVLNKNQLEDNE